MIMEELQGIPSMPDDIILTDICTKTNKKIHYINTDSKISVNVCNVTSRNFLQQLNSLGKDMFLPKGYPGSVSSDYLEYQIWDSCQAFCSSISGTLAMRAVLQGIGVGSEAATPVSAAITWLLKDGTGMIGSILFAWIKGSQLDSDCKKWRLFADILNDIALFIELYIPYVMDYSSYMLCIATIFKALVGTAGSSTRAALITHQAIKGNIADVSAKDGSQEIFVNLCAFVIGIILLKNVTETKQIWTVMCTATMFHLIFNFKAVQCLKINVFNSERFCLSLRIYLPTSTVPTIEQINKKESVFLAMGLRDSAVCGFSIVFGASLKKAVENSKVTGVMLSSIVALFRDKKYFILPYMKKKKLFVTFQKSFTEVDVLKAYFHASLLGISLNYLDGRKNLNVISRCRKNSTIYRLKNALQQYFSEETENIPDKMKTTIFQAYKTCEAFIEKEFAAFSKLCKDEDWAINQHLINIGDWQAEWKYGRKHISFKQCHDEPLVPRVSKPRRSQTPNMQVLVIS